MTLSGVCAHSRLCLEWVGGNYQIRWQGVIYTFITLNVLLRSQLWVSVVLQEAGEKGKEGECTRRNGSVKTWLGAPFRIPLGSFPGPETDHRFENMISI